MFKRILKRKYLMGEILFIVVLLLAVVNGWNNTPPSNAQEKEVATTQVISAREWCNVQLHYNSRPTIGLVEMPDGHDYLIIVVNDGTGLTLSHSMECRKCSQQKTASAK